ncbi:MAG: hypothetical protein HKL99_08645 [Burkholderiales bacterium]|nr:hypothetical protein [Burkholderiales bacterium]
MRYSPPAQADACHDLNDALPDVHLLSNDDYHLMLTSVGAGYSRWKDLAITRWRDDATCNNWGSFCYIRDLANGHVWSTTYQPTLQRADVYETVFSEGLAIIRRLDHGLWIETEMAVSPFDDVEIRKIRISNRSLSRRTIEVTSYAEIALASSAADSAHPAFEKLFLETEILPARQAILCARRVSNAKDQPASMFHQLQASKPAFRAMSYNTDRADFIGRGRTAERPQAMEPGATLSGRSGSVLDAAVSIRYPIELDPGETVVVRWLCGVAQTRKACLQGIERYQGDAASDQILTDATRRGQATLHRLDASEADALLYSELANSLIYANASMRAAPNILALNTQGQSGLWAYAISGDLPIALVQVKHPVHCEWVRELVHAHAYWRGHGLKVDMLFLCQGGGHTTHLAELRALLLRSGKTCNTAELMDQPGGLWTREADAMPPSDRVLLQAASRIVLRDDEGSLLQQLASRRAAVASPRVAAARLAGDVDNVARALRQEHVASPPHAPAHDLLLDCGMGGFSPDGREYVITITPGRMTPVPWINVLANPSFGSLISESGSASTWSENAQAYRLTPWSNDPVGDANTEAYYIRDEDSGQFWSPTLLPTAGGTPYVTRHGFGSSVFEHSENGIESVLRVYVAIDAPIKFAVLKLHNLSADTRRLSVTAYVEWVLGDERAKTGMQLRTEIDASTGAVFARNPYNTDFAGRVAMLDVDGIASASVCGDRLTFLGRNGTLSHPAAMSQTLLSGIVGVALDPCAAIRLPITLAAGQTGELIFRLGAAQDEAAAVSLVQRWRGPTAAQSALDALEQYWAQTLGAVQVQTPDRALDVLTNGWLLYQILACRLWARTAFYQSSGAFGFRDQLQDVMALVHATPGLVRAHLLRSASRQFPEGDVQHWWHPPAGRGIRTRCSDDYLWLPLATCRYVQVTGDTGVLSETVSFLDGTALKADAVSDYALPTTSRHTASLYAHCVRAIEHGLRFGEHGLPLMGSGDWNDGMNLVGVGGKGESVWLGFFLYGVLTQFGELALQRGDVVLVERCTSEATRLRNAIEQSCWDGDWYRRGWFDDGSPLGTSSNTECQIDSIAQSWAVLSGAAEPSRARRAMHAVDTRLVRRDAALIELLAPPFNHSDPSPGYIQGYVRGVRENGGQYTHGAVWVAMAFAALGDAARAWELFNMLNPIRHADSPEAIAVYKTEPYVMASDVYAFAPHAGRGGWTWYTGSAGWMYRFILESLLGLQRIGDQLRLVPCIPRDWTSFQVHYRHLETIYHITVQQTAATDAEPRLTLDGVALAGPAIALIDDGLEHAIEVRCPTRQESN